MSVVQLEEGVEKAGGEEEGEEIMGRDMANNPKEELGRKGGKGDAGHCCRIRHVDVKAVEAIQALWEEAGIQLRTVRNGIV